MAKLDWELDKETEIIAKAINLARNCKKCEQYPGDSYFKVGTWLKHVPVGYTPDVVIIDKDTREEKLCSSPENIINSLASGNFLQGLVLVILWGNMIRTKNRIYTKSLNEIERVLRDTAKTVRKDGSIKNAWVFLRKKLNWSNVIMSKYLHFQVRALKYNCPGVPTDNLIMKNKLYPDLKKKMRAIPTLSKYNLEPWFDNTHSWQPYNRYMTVIITKVTTIETAS